MANAVDLIIAVSGLSVFDGIGYLYNQVSEAYFAYLLNGNFMEFQSKVHACCVCLDNCLWFWGPGYSLGVSHLRNMWRTIDIFTGTATIDQLDIWAYNLADFLNHFSPLLPGFY